MTENKNYLVKVSVIDPETSKKKTEQYLVRAVSVTDAEAKIVKAFESVTTFDEVKAVTETKIIEYIQ